MANPCANPHSCLCTSSKIHRNRLVVWGIQSVIKIYEKKSVGAPSQLSVARPPLLARKLVIADTARNMVQQCVSLLPRIAAMHFAGIIIKQKTEQHFGKVKNGRVANTWMSATLAAIDDIEWTLGWCRRPRGCPLWHEASRASLCEYMDCSR
jgi:hypothetical protein